MQFDMPSAMRVADNRRGRISLQYLDEFQQQRLRASIRAVAGRSLYQWDEVQPRLADVLVLGPDQIGVDVSAPITLWLGDNAPDRPGDDAFHLPSTFTTQTLWGALDLIALRLMDTRKQPVGMQPEPHLETDPMDARPTYRLLKWVTLDAGFQEPRFRQVMAHMTSRSVSLRWLIDHGLEDEEARLLLRTLNQLDVLEINVRDRTVWPTPRAQAQAAPRRFLNLIRHWALGARRTASVER